MSLASQKPTTTIRVSRRGSIDVQIPSEDGTNSNTENIHIPSNLGVSAVSVDSATGSMLDGTSYRQRAIKAIQSTLSPGSEFSFGTSSGDNSVDSRDNTLAKSKSGGIPESKTATNGSSKQRSSTLGHNDNNVNNISFRRTFPHRVSGGIHYVSGVERPTVNALERLESALLRTRSLVDQPKAPTVVTDDSHGVIQEIAFLRNMQNQLSSASNKLLASRTFQPQGSEINPQKPVMETIPHASDPWTSHKTSRSSAARIAAVAPERLELDRTLERLQQAATREGVLRMENIRLRQEVAATSKKASSSSDNVNKNNKKFSTASIANSESLLSGGDRLNSLGDKPSEEAAANLWIKCALLMEKHEETTRRLRVAEASAEAMALRLRKVRESRTVSALTGETDLYHRIEKGLRSVEEVAAPLVEMEQKACVRHEQVAASLADIDMAVRRENAKLVAKVNKLEAQNRALNDLVKGRPTRQAHTAALHRADILATEVRRLRAQCKQAHKQIKKLSNAIVKTEDNEDQAKDMGISSNEQKIEGEPEQKIEQKRQDDRQMRHRGSDSENSIRITTEEMRSAMRRDRTLRGLGTVDLSEPLAALDNYKVDDEKEEENSIRAKSRHAPLSNRYLRIGWAALMAMRDLMRLLDCQDAAGLVDEISKLQITAMTANGMTEHLQKIEDIVDAARTKEGIKSEKEETEENLISDVSMKKERKKSRYESLQTELQIMLDQNRIMAFSQDIPQKQLSDILRHFQMLMGTSSFADIVPSMQKLMEKVRMQRRSLDAIRKIFGMGPTVVGIGGAVDEDSVVDVIRAYTTGQGLSSGN